MGIISVEQSDRLFWLGRYSERVYTTIRLFFKSYDSMIDKLENSYVTFCNLVDIPNIYSDAQDFKARYPFDEDIPDSIISNLLRAYDNAIVLRESIGSESLSYIQLAIYEMNRAKASEAPIIELQKVVDNILAFWGTVDDQIDDEKIRNIIKSGKRIERIDMYARLGLSRKELIREVNRMVPRVERSGLKFNREALLALAEMVSQGELDHYAAVRLVESII